MEITDYELKKLGFRSKAKNKNELEVHVEIEKGNYISISIFKDNNIWMFSGLEIEGEASDRVRKSFFTNYSMDEIIDFLNQY